MVAGEHDAPHRELLALLDLEHEIDRGIVAAGFRLDGLGHDLGIEITVPFIDVEHAHDIVLDRCARQRPAGLRLQILLQILVFDLALPSSASRPMVGFSTTTTRMRSPARESFTLLNRPVA